MEMDREPAIVFCLVDRILGMLRESGATLEQSIAALQSVQAILPIAEFQSKTSITIRSS
jgi:hypothetical protein